jgi:hypothetical protein
MLFCGCGLCNSHYYLFHECRCIVVIPGAQTPSAKKEIINSQHAHKITLEVFTHLELLCHVLEHELVPLHEVTCVLGILVFPHLTHLM